MAQNARQIVIAGGGVAGLATALALSRMGVKSITVLEQASSLRVSGASLTIWDNGWKALDALGVANTLRSQHIRLQRIDTLSTSSGLTQSIDLEGHEVRCVKRKKLLEALAEALPPHTIRFGSKISAMRQTEKSGNVTVLELEDGNQIAPKVLIGCDGVNSAVANWLGLGTPNLAGRSTFLGLANFPQGHGLKPKAFQIWGNGMRGGFSPCNDNDAFWFLSRKSLPRDAEIAYDAKAIQQEALNLVEDLAGKQIADVINRSVPTTVSLSVLKYRHLWPFMADRASKGNVTVAGDAMHPMVPDLGQGGALALEDSVILGRCLGAVDVEDFAKVEEALKKYVEKRKGRAFGMSVGSSLSGILQSGSWWLPRLVREKVLFKKISPKMLRHTEYDCGSLSNLS